MSLNPLRESKFTTLIPICQTGIELTGSLRLRNKSAIGAKTGGIYCGTSLYPTRESNYRQINTIVDVGNPAYNEGEITLLEQNDFFYCPNIVKVDYYGNVYYDAEWVPDDDNFGTTVPYWYALMEPVHGRRNKPEDFNKVNETLFPKGTDLLDIYEWTTDWSDLFDAGHEWYGACCWSIYDSSMRRYVVMLLSATD